MRSSSLRRYILLAALTMVLYALFRRFFFSSSRSSISLSPSTLFQAAHNHTHKMAQQLSFPLNDGHSIPFLGFGTGTALYKQDAQNAVLVALRSGFRHLDGAQMYRNEESLGAAVSAYTSSTSLPRAELFITTKLTVVPEGKTVRDTLVESLAKLKLDYVDLFLVHIPVEHADLKAVWKEMEGVKEEGLARSIGVSNFRLRDFEQIMDGAKIVPAVNQVRFEPILQLLTRHTYTHARRESSV